MNDIKWDRRFLKLAYEVASWSKDESTQVGSVIIGPRRKPISFGYNGLPREVNDDKPERQERPTKYFYFEHAERNAIYNAEQDLTDCTIYITHHPCADCARGIIQKNIKRVVVDKENGINGKLASRHPDSHQATREMFQEAGVEIIEITL